LGYTPAFFTEPARVHDSEILTRQLLGAFLLDSELARPYISRIDVDWVSPDYQKIYGCIVKHIWEGTEFDAVSVATQCQERISKVVALTGESPELSADIVRHRVEGLRDSHYMGKLQDAGADLNAIQETMEEWRRHGFDRQAAVDVFADAIEGVRLRVEKQEPDIPLPWSDFNEITGGFTRGALSVISAPTSHNKTTIALNCVHHVMKEGQRVLYCDYEMGTRGIVYGLTAIAAKMHKHTLLVGRDEFALKKSEEEISRLKTRYEDRFRLLDCPDLGDIEAVMIEHKPDLVVIDHIQLLGQVMPEDKGQTPAYHISNLSRRIRELGNKYGAAMVILSQVNRGSANRMPNLSDLKESGGIEENAHLALLAWWPYKVDPETHTMSNLEVRVAKNRNGPTEKFNLHINPATGFIGQITTDKSLIDLKSVASGS